VRSYGEAFRVPEFTPLFAAFSVQLAAMTVSGLALGTFVYTATGSPPLPALAMFGPSLAQLAGASFLLSAADRCGRRSRAGTYSSRSGCRTGSSSAARPCSSPTRPGTPG
jgi:hypothetical protein